MAECHLERPPETSLLDFSLDFLFLVLHLILILFNLSNRERHWHCLGYSFNSSGLKLDCELHSVQSREYKVYGITWYMMLGMRVFVLIVPGAVIWR